MSKAAWPDDTERELAESLVTTYGHLWPTPCESAQCTKRFPRSFKKDQTSYNNIKIRRFRCGGCRANISVKTALDTLRHISKDPVAADDVVSDVLARMHAARQSSSLPRTTNTSRHQPSTARSLHLSDLESTAQNQDMSDVEDNAEDDDDGVSPLLHFAVPRPPHFQTPASQYVLGTQEFNMPPGQYVHSYSQPQSTMPPGQYMVPPTQTSSYYSQYSPLHPSGQSADSFSAWTPISTGTPARPSPQVPPPQGAMPDRGQSMPPHSRPEPHYPADAGTSAMHGKRRNMDASVWNQKQPRVHSPTPDPIAILQAALDSSDRQN
ncbi:hypothetical protein BGZ83_004415, partial [Gryganskiella cystojenkinii]